VQAFRIEVEPSSAMDAFHHPYAYAAKPEHADHTVQAEPTNVDG